MLPLMLLALGACKSKRKAAPTADEKPLAAVEVRLQKLLENDFSFSELSINGNLTAGMGGESFSTAINVRMQKDKLMWVSIKPLLGIEAFRLLIRPDSVFMVDRLNKQYLEKPFSWLGQMAKAPLDFYLLQDLVLNNAGFLKGLTPLPAPDGSMWFSKSGMELQIATSADDLAIAAALVKQDSQQLQVNYAKYLQFEGQRLPQLIQMRINGTQNGTIDINFSKFAKENGQSYPFSVPGNYTRLD
jgi:hypothetical protein